ncbi:uncharacterized protein [Zea mays]|uniref:Mitochondrial uncoupling protein 1 n=2 Tax=Zea mays TaxID=4577 RepID=A0A804N047_MAIZE|nr:uncharacterized protein LOC103649787 [Zea mays]|eukprot:XP_008673721.1 uncharacterized protein LOC103649787 [Zea mays]
MVTASSFTAIFFRSAFVACFAEVKAFFVRGAVVGDVSLLSKILAALATGVIAIVVANPTDLVNVRLQVDGKANTVKRSYSRALNVYAIIIRHVTLTIMGSSSLLCLQEYFASDDMCLEDGILAIVKQDERPLELLAKAYAINSFDIDPQNPSDVVFTLEWESVGVLPCGEKKDNFYYRGTSEF